MFAPDPLQSPHFTCVGISIFSFLPPNASSRVIEASYCKSDPRLLVLPPPPLNGDESLKKLENISSNEKLEESKPPPAFPSTPA